MRFGICPPCRGALGTPDNLLRVARHAEEAGMDTVWVSDHVVMPVDVKSEFPYTPGRPFPVDAMADYLDPIVALTLIAARTTRVRLGTSILVVPLRSPLAVAKALATLDVVSGGRLVVGVAAGWMREEFEAVGAPPFAERGAVTDEYLRAMKTLWTSDPATFDGRYVRFPAVHCRPQPVQRPHPPLIVGGWSRAAMRRAAALGDGWQPPLGPGPEKGLGPAKLAAEVAALRDMAKQAGRDAQALRIQFKAPLRVTAERSPRGHRLFNGAAEDVAADVRAYAEAGVQEFVFDLATNEVDEMLDTITRFMRDVKPRVAK
jgi:probable F420-dependent oxidoreductase